MLNIFAPLQVILLTAGLVPVIDSLGESTHIAGFSALKSAEPQAQQRSLKIWENGTAYVRGEVEEHNFDCRVDGACYLKLHVDHTEVRVVYNEGDVPRTCTNNQADHAQPIKKGDWIKAFGFYNKNGQTVTISTCASADYFIRYADEETPLGPVTEHFFDDVGMLKNDVARSQFEARKSGKWEVYRNKELGYEFSYPATWQPAQTSTGAPWAITYHDFSRTDNDWYVLTLSYISQAQQATMGIDFCTANPSSSRCESRQIGTATASIDWGNSKIAFVKIPLPNGGIVTFTLEPSTTRARSLFLSILDTFKIK